MDVFISWSGEPSKTVALVLRDFVQDVIQLSKPFMSKHDLEAGSRWPQELSKRLSSTNVGIACITPNNMHSDWLLFEAGALTKQLNESRLCTCLFGVKPSEVAWPLAQFQGNTADKDGIWNIIETVNEALGDNRLEANRLKRAFESHWPSCEKRLDEITLDPPKEGAEPSRGVEDKLDEVLSILRGLQRESVVRLRNRSEIMRGDVQIPRSNLARAIPRDIDLSDLQRLLPGLFSGESSSATMSTTTTTPPPELEPGESVE